MGNQFSRAVLCGLGPRQEVKFWWPQGALALITLVVVQLSSSGIVEVARSASLEYPWWNLWEDAVVEETKMSLSLSWNGMTAAQQKCLIDRGNLSVLLARGASLSAESLGIVNRLARWEREVEGECRD